MLDISFCLDVHATQFLPPEADLYQLQEGHAVRPGHCPRVLTLGHLDCRLQVTSLPDRHTIPRCSRQHTTPRILLRDILRTPLVSTRVSGSHSFAICALRGPDGVEHGPGNATLSPRQQALDWAPAMCPLRDAGTQGSEFPLGLRINHRCLGLSSSLSVCSRATGSSPLTPWSL